MLNEELENIDSQMDEEETIDSSNDNDEVEEEETTEQPEYTENEKQLYARMKKAEKEAKELREAGSKKPTPKKKESSDSALSTSDIIALTKADIDDEDIDEVLDYAKYKGISVREALNSTILKSTISEAAEQRKSAQAVNTGSSRRASGNISDERLLADARKGAMPEKEEDIARLAVLRFKNK